MRGCEFKSRTGYKFFTFFVNSNLESMTGVFRQKLDFCAFLWPIREIKDYYFTRLINFSRAETDLRGESPFDSSESCDKSSFSLFKL